MERIEKSSGSPNSLLNTSEAINKIENVDAKVKDRTKAGPKLRAEQTHIMKPVERSGFCSMCRLALGTYKLASAKPDIPLLIAVSLYVFRSCAL